VAARLVRDGRADGLISAGNTGAVMTTAKILLGTLEGVERPALAQVFPSSQKGKASVLLDVGANVDCKPLHLEQFAVMGEIYYRVIFGAERPRVGLLSNGSEPHKGNEVTREALARLNELNLNFVGNVEGRDLFNGRVEVIIADGFIGNVALKISEGIVDTVTSLLKESLASTFSSKLGYLLSRKAFARMKKRLDYSEYGGAPLLGVKGVCIICHGGSNANAIKNAVRVAAEFSEGRVNEKIERELALASLSKN
jgi:glycerol-3-phosphate acyltransferase PlsX